MKFENSFFSYVLIKRNFLQGDFSYLFVRHFDACPLHLHLPPTAKSANEK